MKNALIAAVLLGAAATNVVAEEMIALPESCQMRELSVIQCPLADGISAQDAIDSMKLRANTLNFKLVAHMPLSEQVKAMGEDARRMEIYQFCDALIAKRMVEHDMVFASFLPCRIALVEDKDGKNWLITLNMDQMLGQVALPGELQGLGATVRNNIYSIVGAGVNGDL
ncbi:MAG: DUF302 domain-containing protein [Chromatiales bacterium]|nr:DUF302 domain-containing protein [Chromatiales bacterium]